MTENKLTEISQSQANEELHKHAYLTENYSDPDNQMHSRPDKREGVARPPKADRPLATGGAR